jgi:hypothetical protein
MTTPTALRIGLAAVALLALSGCTSDADWASGDGLGSPVAAAAATTPTTAPAPEWLFAVQSDGDTTFDASTGRLSMPAGTVHAFTDRPYRDTRATSPQSFVDLWQRSAPNSFEADPPNAVLTYWETTGDTSVPRTVVCEITGDVDYSSADGLLSMGLRVLDPEGATLSATMSRASLFVDDVAEPPCENSPTDEANVEYFNMLEFQEEISLGIQYDAAADEYQVSLDCPDRPSPTVPSSVFDVRLTSATDVDTVSCYSDDTISVPADPATSAFCKRRGRLHLRRVRAEHADDRGVQPDRALGADQRRRHPRTGPGPGDAADLRQRARDRRAQRLTQGTGQPGHG